jgi:hypothetical protein
MSNYIELCEKERDENIPETGFNVLTFDSFARPGERLTLIGNVDSLDEAKAIKRTLKGVEVLIYSSDGKTN